MEVRRRVNARVKKARTSDGKIWRRREWRRGGEGEDDGKEKGGSYEVSDTGKRRAQTRRGEGEGRNGELRRTTAVQLLSELTIPRLGIGS
jgi:hypothetical protein